MWIVNTDVLERVVFAYFNVLLHLLGGTEEILQSR
jgi:hypothetical protein